LLTGKELNDPHCREAMRVRPGRNSGGEKISDKKDNDTSGVRGENL